MTTPQQVLSDEQRQAIIADNSLDTIDAVARAALQCAQAPQATKGGEA